MSIVFSVFVLLVGLYFFFIKDLHIRLEHVIVLVTKEKQMQIKQITNRLEELHDQKKLIEAEIEFLYDQLIEIRMIAEEYNSCALQAMNGGEAHV